MNGEQTGRTAHAALGLLRRSMSAGLAAISLAACSRAPFSSPTALRDTNAYAKAISPVEPAAIDTGALDRVAVSREGETLVATLPAVSGPDDRGDGFPHAIHRLAPGGRIPGDDAAFEVVAFSVGGRGISSVPAGDEKHVAVSFFAPDGRPLAKEELKAMGFRDWQLTEYVGEDDSYLGDAFPKIKVWFGSRKQPPGYYTPVGCFDARTRHSLVSGHSWSQISSDSLGYAELRPRLWHGTPIEVMLDVQLDGRVMLESDAVAGTTVAVPGGLVRMLGIWDGDSHSWSSQSGSAAGVQTLRITLQDRADQTNAVALFVTEPPALAVHVELLDARGKQFDGAGGGTVGGIRMVGLRGQASEVKRVRFTTFTNHHRVVMTLPPIPNLPQAGVKAENLFEVPIPRVVLRREYELREVIEDMTQMRFPYPPDGDMIPTNLFPMTLTNVTPAGLVAVYRSHLTNSSNIVVDEQKLEIRIELTPFEKARRWLKQKLRL